MTDLIERLYCDVVACRGKHAGSSRTAKLLQSGVPKMARKVAEEAIEVSLDAVAGNRQAVILESVDLIYNLAVLWSALDVKPQHIWKEMERRENIYGICEKLPKVGAKSSAAKTASATDVVRVFQVADEGGSVLATAPFSEATEQIENPLKHAPAPLFSRPMVASQLPKRRLDRA
jgi:phosphoribosyl-ATP pyrophosphohydrolase